MTSHELAKVLLTRPDVEIATGPLHYSGFISEIEQVQEGTYPAPSWADDAGKNRPVVVLVPAEESLNEDEAINVKPI